MDYKSSVHKFSTKPPGYEAARQRENQRRHRARVKCRITDLEAKLETTQNRLDEALKLIEKLTAEVQRLQSTSITEPTPQPPNRTRSSNTIAKTSEAVATHCNCDAGCNASESTQYSEERLCLPSNSVIPTAPQNLSSTLAPELCNASTVPLTIIQTSETSVQPNSHQPRQDIADDPHDDCDFLPSASPGESTMRCREAFSMIKDRVMPEYDPELVSEWLKPGFRRAICPGDGCRVQTHVLFAFVDHITSG